jgi:uncharacterized RDD family membrane protein YckC
MQAGLPRRLAAMFYDGLLLVAILMIATALLLPLTGGEAITPADHPWLAFAYRLVIAGLVVLFFGTFWTRRGQTLGMASWRLRVEREDGSLLTWSDTVKRLAAALLSWLPLGLGYLWILFDREGRAWHDRLTRTRVVLLPKRVNGRDSTSRA